MSKLFELNESEKDRILGLHKSATKNNYLIEQSRSSVDSTYVAKPIQKMNFGEKPVDSTTSPTDNNKAELSDLPATDTTDFATKWSTFYPCVPELAAQKGVKMNTADGSYSIGDFAYFYTGRKFNLKTRVMGNFSCHDSEFNGGIKKQKVQMQPASNLDDVINKGKFIFQGMTGPLVEQIQRMIGMTSFDGKFGPSTKQALMVFQKKNGLTPDGIVGKKTATVLLNMQTTKKDVGNVSTVSAKDTTTQNITTDALNKGKYNTNINRIQTPSNTTQSNDQTIPVGTSRENKDYGTREIWDGTKWVPESEYNPTPTTP